MAQQTAAIAAAQGAKVEVPTVVALRAQFDEWLMEDPEEDDPVQFVKMRALGVSKGR